ncbi:MAG: hypothetical protein HOD35_01190 [Euryarchaeota archaeon]|jgi:hypothetical protein|nr:hypothetical protein [Euryarchaeota archaeon]MBT4391254.1 hypothetical protein [Euryarchaeota archaeon]
MGLLEKAGKIQTNEKTNEDPIPVVMEAVVEAKPIATKKASRKKKEKAPKKVRTPKVKRTRVSKDLPEGFEIATRGQKVTRRFVDFAISYGWSVPILGINVWGNAPDSTYLILIGMLLVVGNLGVLPSQTGRTVGNWVSRTQYVNTRGESPIWIFLLLKGLTTVFVLFGVFAVFITTANLSLGDSTVSKIFTLIGLLMLLPPLIDYFMYRFRKNSEHGLWDTMFGGIWMVRTNRSAEAKGWLKRLESLGDYAESKGLLSDKDTD